MTEERSSREDLGTRLRDARKYCGFSQEEVARHLSVSRSAVSLMESGSRSVNAMELGRLARLYQRSMESLTGTASSESGSASVGLLARATAELSERDRQEVLRFAEFLRSRSSTSD